MVLIAIIILCRMEKARYCVCSWFVRIKAVWLQLYVTQDLNCVGTENGYAHFQRLLHVIR